MPAETTRILTTHGGSLPRSQAVAGLRMARENAEPYAPEEFEHVMRAAIDEVVRLQARTGIDIVSDGETAKISYATYVHERLSGVAGDHPRQVALDLEDYPDFRARVADFVGQADLERDIANLRAALGSVSVQAGCLNAASPGVVSAFEPNAHYPSHAAYVEAIGEAMRAEYEAIAAAGLLLQLDCPDLAMARHTGFQDLSAAQFLARAQHQVEVLDHSLRNIPSDALRMHICWGNYEGPHDYVEHPELIVQRIGVYADIVGRERVQAGTDCGFGTFAGIGKMDPGISWKKLAALAEGAARASTRLWGRPGAASGA